MSVFVVSDLHISGSDDPLYLSLLTLLRNRVSSGDTFVLAGDIFDFFIGRKKIFVEEYAEFIECAKKAAARGVHIHYIEGNHDFLLHGVFKKDSGVHLHAEKIELEIDDKKFFFAHGDLADAKDYGYRALRGFLRSPILKFALAVTPGKAVNAIGTKSSKYSRKSIPRLPAELPLDRRERLRNVYRSFAAEKLCEGHDFVVMGHCHDLDEKFFTIGSRRGQYINVGYPRAHGSFLSWNPGDETIGREKLPEGKPTL